MRRIFFGRQANEIIVGIRTQYCHIRYCIREPPYHVTPPIGCTSTTSPILEAWAARGLTGTPASSLRGAHHRSRSWSAPRGTHVTVTDSSALQRARKTNARENRKDGLRDKIPEERPLRTSVYDCTKQAKYSLQLKVAVVVVP